MRNKNYKNLYSQAAQQTLKNLAESLKSFKGLLNKFLKGGLHFCPSLPNYRKSGGLYTVSYPSQALKLVNSQIQIPLGKQIKAWDAKGGTFGVGLSHIAVLLEIGTENLAIARVEQDICSSLR